MKRVTLLFIIFFTTFAPSLAQTSLNTMLFVIDSIPLLGDPPPFNELWEEDIVTSTTVKNIEGITIPGKTYPDSITYIFTKEYVARPADIKRIPSLAQMEMKDSVWKLHGTPFTGPFIDYYYSGKKYREGLLLNGRFNAEERYYFQNGRVTAIYNYDNGRQSGVGISYYFNGDIQSKGIYHEDGQWAGESYFPNGVIQSRSSGRNKDGYDFFTNYFSTGTTKEVLTFKSGKLIIDSGIKRSILLNKKIALIEKATTHKAAKKIAFEIIKLDSLNADVYSSLGLFMLGRNRFDEAIAAFDQALKIEPYIIGFLVYRALARIKRFASSNKHSVSGFTNIPVDELTNVDLIPNAELEKICADLKRANSLRTIYSNLFDKLLIGMLKKYCGMDIRR